MRPDYCPMVNEPCQSMCDTPCSVNKIARHRTWVGLTDSEIDQMGLSNYIKVVRQTEAKLKEKNT